MWHARWVFEKHKPKGFWGSWNQWQSSFDLVLFDPYLPAKHFLALVGQCNRSNATRPDWSSRRRDRTTGPLHLLCWETRSIRLIPQLSSIHSHPIRHERGGGGPLYGICWKIGNSSPNCSIPASHYKNILLSIFVPPNPFWVSVF